MGIAITHESFSQDDYQQFSNRLDIQLDLLNQAMSQPGFGVGPSTLGAELEVSLVDTNFEALHINHAIMRDLSHPKVQLELNQFNLEYNLEPLQFNDSPFTKTLAEIESALEMIQDAADAYQARLVTIGILPTLGSRDLSPEAMTDLARYRALSNSLRQMRGGPFRIDISGRDHLQTTCDDLTLEGANNSFQVHLNSTQDNFVDVYNAAQLVTPLAVALSGNSPTLLKKQLWEETRIALFKQSVDSRRDDSNRDWREPHRVSFGYGWLRESPLELFAQGVSLFPPILPEVSKDPVDALSSDGLPLLNELCLHQGAIWHWNRPIYDPTGNGHVRLEMRTLPSGPTAVDMVANMAYLIGMTIGIMPHIERILPSFPFMYAEYNFYRAAQKGLEARVVWPDESFHYPDDKPVRTVILDLLPLAKEGLMRLGLASEEAEYWLSIIETRVKKGQTSSRWQVKFLDKHTRTSDLNERYRDLLKVYMEMAATGIPVGQWESP